MLVDCRAFGSKVNLKDSVATKLYGILDTTIVRFVLGKPMAKEVNSARQIACDFAASAKDATGSDIENPWKEHSQPSFAETVKTLAPNVVDFTSSGAVSGVAKLNLTRKGFAADQSVVHTKSGQV